jgi:serine/threonine protein kinase
MNLSLTIISSNSIPINGHALTHTKYSNHLITYMQIYMSRYLQPKSTVGTPAYIAPEVLQRKTYSGCVETPAHKARSVPTHYATCTSY